FLLNTIFIRPSTTHSRFVLKSIPGCWFETIMAKPPMNTVKNRSLCMFRYRAFTLFFVFFSILCAGSDINEKNNKNVFIAWHYIKSKIIQM
ncbi:TPA: hypothetical protein ACHJ82_004506, partial [Escherichia coli]